jgi:hypothetical protein
MLKDQHQKQGHGNKMISDSFTMTGDVTIELFGPDNRLKDKRFIKNLVLTNGKTLAASRFAGNSLSVLSHMALGTGSTAPDIGDTTLEGEIDRIALLSAAPSLNTITYIASFAPGVATGLLTEAGLFNAAFAGTMAARTTFGQVSKGAGDTIVITWVITIN